jgi:hypothetical protein
MRIALAGPFSRCIYSCRGGMAKGYSTGLALGMVGYNVLYQIKKCKLHGKFDFYHRKIM